MSPAYHRVLLVFVDGVGLDRAGSSNPLSECDSPHLRELLGGSMTSEQIQSSAGLLLQPLDAVLGVEGLPQSATGQTALFSGVNAPTELGRHVTGFPGPRLKSILDESNLFEGASSRGWRVTFANAYGQSYLDEVLAGGRRISVTTYCMLRAALRFRGVGDLRRGRAVTWDVCRDLYGARSGVELDAVAPHRAGLHLADIANDHDLTIYETFYSDLAGHGRPEADRCEAVRRIDGLVGGALQGLDDDVSLVLTSDHGNLERSDVRAHTSNLVPLLVCGAAASVFAAGSSLTDVSPTIMRLLAGEVVAGGTGA